MRSTELVPLHAVFATDFIAILVTVTTDSTMAQVAEAGLNPLDHVTVEYDSAEATA